MSTSSALNSLLSSSSSSSSSTVDLSSLLTAATGSTSTGIDVTQAVDAAIYAAQAPERQWQTEQATIQSQITALSSIQTATSGLSSDLNNLADPLGVLAAKTVTSSASSAITASATSSATAGTHTISVSQLATATSWYSSVLAGSSATLGSSSLTITQANGTQTNFALGTTNSSTLSSLVQSINSAGLGISASIVQDASGARLSLVGQTTGTTSDFSVSETATPASTWSSADVASGSTALPSSSFQISDGTSNAEITVAAGSSLSDVADQINGAGLNLSASVVQDGAGYHLSVVSNDGQNIALSQDPALVLTQPVKAQNASLTVDGVPITSSSNTITGAVNGLTFDLTGTTATGAPATLTVAADSTQINSAVSQFVSDFNSAVALLSAQFTFNSSTSSQGVLGSDATVRNLQSMLLGSIGYSVPTSASGAGASLASLGISMNDDGTLTLNTTALDQAITASPSTVQNFFQGSTGFASHMRTQLSSFTAPSSGSLATDVSNLTQQYNDLQSDVNNFESGYIASQKTVLTNMYSKAEIALESLPTTLKQIQAELSNNSGS